MRSLRPVTLGAVLCKIVATLRKNWQHAHTNTAEAGRPTFERISNPSDYQAADSYVALLVGLPRFIFAREHVKGVSTVLLDLSVSLDSMLGGGNSVHT